MSQFRGPRLGTSEFIGVELQRSDIRRFKGVRSEMQIWMFGGSAVQSSEMQRFRVQTFGSL